MAYQIQRHEAITSLKPNSSFVLDGNKLNWFDEKQTEPTSAEIDAEIIRLQAEYDANQYQRDRKPEYPSMADQLDYIYHNGIAKWKSDIIKPVKDAHPKP